ncbi:AMP-binding protein [Auritidibacter sp. NML100628]|uniref:AMP-binding protein n=1 Tax=Auritidibacter sp. NML100628 TaxID=2170742 RepID=UPI000D736F47|nr:AMP-binding protein [Auritidibacter sp. NML100628]PXA77079.1 phenazine antibiotic biosynthesis protein [Auritidibacter sp. NML100628]
MTSTFHDRQDQLSSDPQAFLQEALRWHFSEDTGSPLWLRLAEDLDFDPLTEIKDYRDLARFPDIAQHLRDSPVADLKPRGLSEGSPPAVYETGGTTGSPKRLLYTDSWIARALEWKHQEFIEAGFPLGADWLVAMPSGPHAFGHTSRLQAHRLGSVLHTIDIDPRWVKKLVGHGSGADAYVNHLIEQIGHIIRTQRIGAVTTTPPIFTELMLHDDLIDALRPSLRYLGFAGAHLDEDTRTLIEESFPDVIIQNIYGSTMVLTTARLRQETLPGGGSIYDGYPPFVTFHIVDPDTLEPVPLGQRGQVRMSHISSGAFIPNNLERDSAIRIASAGSIGDALGAPQPLQSFEGENVVQGVY